MIEIGLTVAGKATVVVEWEGLELRFREPHGQLDQRVAIGQNALLIIACAEGVQAGGAKVEAEFEVPEIAVDPPRAGGNPIQVSAHEACLEC